MPEGGGLLEQRGGLQRVVAEALHDRRDPETGLTAMMRMTGFPAAIVAALRARGIEVIDSEEPIA